MGNSASSGPETEQRMLMRSRSALEDVQDTAPTLTALDFTGSRIDADGAVALAAHLQENCILRRVNLRWNHIRDKGLAALMPVFAKASELERLTLCGNELGDTGVALLAHLLKEKHTIQFLDLSSNSIHDAGVEALAAALADNHSCSELNLSSNEFGASGAAALATSLGRNQCLTELSIASNTIGSQGAEDFAKVLRKNQTCTRLDLGWNGIGSSGSEALRDAMRINQTIVSLGLTESDVGDRRAVLHLQEALQRNMLYKETLLRVKGLVEAGVSRRAIDAEIAKAPGLLHGACRHSRLDVLKFLADCMATFDVKEGRELETPLHVAAAAGLVPVVRLLVNLVANGGHHLLREPNRNLDTPLHLGAREGHFEVCQILVMRGAPLVGRNRQSHTPEDLARERGHCSVMDFLVSRKRPYTIRGGKGDAMEKAMRDRRVIVKVEWFTLPLPGLVGSIGAHHSLLVITVRRLSKTRGSRRHSLGDDDEHAYIIEKAEGSLRGRESENGVFVSDWLDVSGNIDTQSFAVVMGGKLENCTGQTEFTIRTLRDMAVTMGKYDVGECNCHHMALRLFNACAVESARISAMPDQFLTGVAKSLKFLGIDVAAGSGSASSRIPIPSTDLHSRPVSSSTDQQGLYGGAEDFSLDETSPRPANDWPHHSAALSEWIYHPASQQRTLTLCNKLSETIVVHVEGALPHVTTLQPGRSVLLCETPATTATATTGEASIRVEKTQGLFGRVLVRSKVSMHHSYSVVPATAGSGGGTAGGTPVARLECVPHTPLPEGLAVDYVAFVEDLHGSPVQWGVASSKDTIHVTFRGTEQLIDGLVEVSFLSLAAAQGIRVHSGMWCALHQLHADVTTAVMEQIQRARRRLGRCLRRDREQNQPFTHHERLRAGLDSPHRNSPTGVLSQEDEEEQEAERQRFMSAADKESQDAEDLKLGTSKLRHIVLSGHSLGGAYAVLTALDMLDRFGKESVSAVLTHGAPQVVVPPEEDEETSALGALALWRLLNRKTRNFVHAYDIVPRLPSCEDWIFQVIPSPQFLYANMGPLAIALDGAALIDSKLRPQWSVMARYDSVGDTILVNQASRRGMLLRWNDPKRKEILGRTPKSVGQFVVTHHAVANYVSITARIAEAVALPSSATTLRPLPARPSLPQLDPPQHLATIARASASTAAAPPSSLPTGANQGNADSSSRRRPRSGQDSPPLVDTGPVRGGGSLLPPAPTSEPPRCCEPEVSVLEGSSLVLDDRRHTKSCGDNSSKRRKIGDSEW